MVEIVCVVAEAVAGAGAAAVIVARRKEVETLS